MYCTAFNNSMGKVYLSSINALKRDGRLVDLIGEPTVTDWWMNLPVCRNAGRLGDSEPVDRADARYGANG